MTPTYVFLTGMIRSGTTLLSRMLSAHPAIEIAADPYRGIFLSYRDAVAYQAGIPVAPLSPLAPYYFDYAGLKLFRTIQKASLHRKVPEGMFGPIIEATRKWATCGEGSNIEPFPRGVDGYADIQEAETYAGLLANALTVLRSAYSVEDKAPAIIGHKEVWCTEFVPAYLRSFPQAKAIAIVRDPRAVAASKNAWPAKYPWLMLARQWRKLAALSWHYAQGAQDVGSNFAVIRYEDLIAQPQAIMEQVSAFLGVDFDERMIDPEHWVDQDGEPWKQNSLHPTEGNRFDTAALDRWKETLSPEVIRLIEIVCQIEMALYEYRPNTAYQPGEDLTSFFYVPPVVPAKDVADWVHEFWPSDSISAMKQMGDEAIRSMMQVSDEKYLNVAVDQVESAFLVPDVLAFAKANAGDAG